MRKITLPICFLCTFFFAKAQSAPPPITDYSKQTASPQEICEGSIGALNMMGTKGFGQLSGSVSYESTERGLKLREFYSRQNFPGSQETIIVDTNVLSRYFQMKALMFTETTSSEQIPKNAIDYFNMMGTLLKTCLTPQKFKEDYSAQLVKIHEIKMAYRFQIPSDVNSLFPTMELAQSLVVELYLDKKKNKDATYTYEFYLHFKRI